MGFFRKSRPERITLGGYLDELSSVLNARIASGPPQTWLDAYNEKALAQTLGLKTTTIFGFGKSESVLYPPTPLIFTPDMPSVFYEREPGKPYRGNDNAKERIDNRINSIRPQERVKFLLSGPAGTGKTTLGWILAFRLMTQRISMGLPEGRFFEILGEQIETKSQWDVFMSQLKPYDTVFIDEIHVLQQAIGVEALYATLADTGRPRYPLGEGQGWLDIDSSISWVGATTHPGDLDPALRRRLEPEIRVEPPTLEELAEIVKDQDMPVVEEAAVSIAQRSGGLPWQALNVYGEARAIARVNHSNALTMSHAERAFEIMGVDENGLLPEDRTILKVLLNVSHRMANGTIIHRMNEGALCAASGVDRLTFKDRCQPKLMRLGLLTTVGGQTLTDKAISEYGFLK